MSLRIRAPRRIVDAPAPGEAAPRRRSVPGGRRNGGDFPEGDFVPPEYAGGDDYQSRLVKLIPIEAVTAYPFLHSRAVDVVDASIRSGAGANSAEATTGLSPTVVRLAQAGAATDAGSTATAASASTAAAGLPMIAWLPAFVAWITLLVVILLRWHATRDVITGKPQWGAVIIAAVSFMLWVPLLDAGASDTAVASFGLFHSLTAAGLPIEPPVQRFIPELLLVFWTILVPVFYRPEG